MNSGFTCDGCSYRIERIGGFSFPVRFSTFSPIAVTSIGALPGTVTDRAIVIPMRRKLPTEKLPTCRKFDGTELKRKCLRWVEDNNDEALAKMEPLFPTQLDDRRKDCWESLLLLADKVGGKWSALAREAAVTLSLVGTDDGEGNEDLLLRDIRNIFDQVGVDRMFSKTVARSLLEIKDGPWTTVSNGCPLTPHKLSRMLSAFGIASGTIRIGKATDKGYYREQFLDAWRRYLSEETELNQPAPNPQAGPNP